MFVVTVDFHIHAGQSEAFLPLMLQNAKESLNKEPHCVRFDVCVNPKDKHHVFLYEIYRAQLDFDVHLKTPHFVEFNVLTAAFVAKKEVHTFDLALS